MSREGHDQALRALPVTELTGSRDAPGHDYRDGVEERLLDVFALAPPLAEAEVRRILQGTPTWPERVHLSPQRHHLLDWFPFDPQARVLEVGAGCGALTGLLAARVARVDALEPSPTRAAVLARRHRELRNLRVLAGDLAALTDTGYDYVTMVGVLEYAGQYAARPGDDRARTPYLRLLGQARRVLAPGGVLLVALENQLGLKYLAGHAEDHYGFPLVGIEDYLEDRGVRSFGRGELGGLLEDSGFAVERWYYPFPDYKLPTSVYSDDQPLGSVEHPAVLFPTLDYAAGGGSYLAESRLARVLARNALASSFANSFLVVCRAR